MTAKITPMLAAAALAVLACAAAPAPTGEQASAALRFERVLLAPFNLALNAPRELQDIDEPVRYELLRHFQAQDRQVTLIAPVDAELLWTDTVAELQQFGAKLDLTTASSHFARRVAGEVRYELLLMPSLVLRSARVRGRLASWDGVHRRLHVRGPPMNGPIIEIGLPGENPAVWGLTGTVSAASLHVALLSSDGRFVYQGLAGLDLIQEAIPDRRAARETWQLVLRKDPFADVEAVREGIALAFERELPTTAYSW
jgi:hypothetical protein